jgi:DNA-binding PadR family transcriptional regulator
LLPLTDAMFHILLALLGEPRHGYGILLEIEERSEGRLRLGTGTLYTSIRRLRDKGLVEEQPRGRSRAGEDERRIYYRLTPLGERATAAEARRLESLVAQARAKGALPRGAR